MHGQIVEQGEGKLPRLVLPINNKLTGVVYRGLSYYDSWLKCRRQKILDGLKGGFASTDAAIGGIFHKLVEIYYLGEFDKYVIDCTDPKNPDWIEAVRLFAAYRKLFPPTEFTRVVACEQVANLGAREKDEPRFLPGIGMHSGLSEFQAASTEWVLARRACQDKFGVPELGVIIDNVVDLDEECIKTLAVTRQLPPTLEPGRYLLDTKTKKQRDPNMETVALRLVQFKLYMMAAEDVPSIGPVKGLITNFVVRHKELEPKKSFVSTFVPPITEADRIFVKSYLTKCRERSEYHLARGEKDPANPALCQLYAGCPHLESGECNRL